MANPTSNPYLITGVRIPGEEPTVHPRLEIRELVKKPEQFTWFILGWLELYNPNYRIPAASFVAQGGIHGLPYKRWVGDPTEATTQPEDAAGYCNHASVLFPAWHRPSILLLEQSISEAVQSLIPQYIDKDTKEPEKWIAAAKELRFPYWDWTHPDTGTEGLPGIFCQEMLELKLPNGSVGEMENILAFYPFGDERPAGFTNLFEEYEDSNNPKIKRARMAYFKNWKRTYRWPAAKSQDPKEDYTELNKLIAYSRLKGTTKNPVRGNWRELTRSVALLFNFPDASQVIQEKRANLWDEFSNTRFQSAKKNRNEWIPDAPRWNCGSIEQPHNNVHVVLGGTGHMADPDYASFDPIFYLHHCNIDRIIAFWEHIYPEYWMADGQYWTPPHNETPGHFIDWGKYGVPADSKVEENSPLTPFRKEDGSYWTPKDLRWHSKGGKSMSYTYPPIADTKDPSQVVSLEPVDDKTRIDQARILKRHFEHGVPVDSPKAHIVSVQLNPAAFKGSYTVEILYDKPSGELEYIASAAAFSRAPDTQCSGCQARLEAGETSENIILIPDNVIDEIVKAWGLEHESIPIEEILKQHLRSQIAFPAEGGVVAASSKSSTATDHPHGERLAAAAAAARSRSAVLSEPQSASVKLDLQDYQKPKFQLHSRPAYLGAPQAPEGGRGPSHLPPPSKWENHGVLLDDWF